MGRWKSHHEISIYCCWQYFHQITEFSFEHGIGKRNVPFHYPCVYLHFYCRILLKFLIYIYIYIYIYVCVCVCVLVHQYC